MRLGQEAEHVKEKKERLAGIESSNVRTMKMAVVQKLAKREMNGE